MSRGGRRHISNALCRVLSSLNDKPNGIYILPTAPMPTEKLITYLPTYDKTILYVMITLVSINLMILLYKFLTRKLQHSTIALELSTGHRCITSLCNPRDHCTHSLFQDYCIVKLITSNHLTYLHMGTTLWRGIVLYALVPKTMHGVIVGKRVRTRRLSDRYCTRVWMSGMIWCDH